jgi:type VI secretion system protein ImpJ
MVLLKTDAIQWHEGMLLLPQHFQQNDERLQELINFHISEVSPYHWGIKSFEIEESLLVNGMLQITILEAIMPDSTVISSYASEGEVVTLDLTEYEADFDREDQLIYVGIPLYVKGAANASNSNSRYATIEGEPVVDENTGDGETRIPRLVPNLSLFVGNKPPSTYASFPIMLIGRDSNAYMQKDLIPPVLKVRKNSALGKKCTFICSRIREKVAYLSERMLSRTEGYMTRDAEDAARALSTGLIPFEAYLNSQATHPFQLYTSLCSLAGHVAALHPSQIPPLFEPYDHDNLQATYDRVVNFIFLMIDRIQEGYAVVPFVQQGRDYALTLRKEWMEEKFILGAKSPVTMSMHELAAWVQSCVIVTDSFVTSSMDNRVLGLTRKLVSGNDKLQLVPANNVILFEAVMDKQFIIPGEKMHIFNVSDEDAKRPIEIVMYVPKTTGS